MSIGGVSPRYQEIIGRLNRHFPTASGQGLVSLAKLTTRALLELSQRQVLTSRVRSLENRAFRIHTEFNPQPMEVVKYLVRLFGGIPIWSDPKVQMNLMPPTTTVSIVATMLTAIFNPDLCSKALSGGNIFELEKSVIRTFNLLFGYDPENAYGFFTYGATLGIEYAINRSLDRYDPNRRMHGMGAIKPKIICSDSSHYCVSDIAARLGLGRENVVLVPTNDNGEMDLDSLKGELDKVYKSGGEVAFVLGTAGTTDRCGFDDISGISSILSQYKNGKEKDKEIYFHVDAAVGWSWAFFKDYDFTTNYLGFSEEVLNGLTRVLERLKGTDKADSVGFNTHKYGYSVIPGSFILFRENGLIARHPTEMRPLHTVESFEPGAHTIETTRTAMGVLVAAANLMFFGRDGYRAVTGNIVEAGISLRKGLSLIPGIELVNKEGVGGGTVFYVKDDTGNYSEGKTQTLLKHLEQKGFYLSTTLDSSNRVLIKSIIMSPFINEQIVDEEILAVKAFFGSR